MAGFELQIWDQEFVWSVVNRLIKLRFPQVKQISSNSLRAWLANPEPKPPLLIDTRSQPEYEVSHLPQALWLDPDRRDFADLNLDLQTPIVTYCSVGYRSAAIASRLQAAGYEQVSNLEGSLFRWANQGQPVYRQGLPVAQVHPYNSLWGCLLDPSHHAYEPP